MVLANKNADNMIDNNDDNNNTREIQMKNLKVQ
jgi:hypothetical protein